MLKPETHERMISLARRAEALSLKVAIQISMLRKPEPKQAIAYFDDIIKNAPSQDWGLWAHAHRGKVNLMMGNYSKAIHDFDEALEDKGIESEYTWAIAMKAEVMRLNGSKDEALKYFGTVLERDPDDAWALAHYAAAALNARRKPEYLRKECLPKLEKAIELMGDYPWAELYKAATLHYIGDLSESSKDNSQAYLALFDAALKGPHILQLNPRPQDERIAIGLEPSVDPMVYPDVLPPFADLSLGS